jgi:hypothetical protein
VVIFEVDIYLQDDQLALVDDSIKKHRVVGVKVMPRWCYIILLCTEQQNTNEIDHNEVSETAQI